MLPSGHVAAGFLTGVVLLKFSHTIFLPSEVNSLLWLSVFFGFAPDIDVFFVFFKTSSLLVCGDEKVNHRKYFTHAPILWLIAGLAVYFLADSEFYKHVGLIIWLASWSHFILDSIEHGVMWLWPLSNKVFALKSTGQRHVISEKNFFKHTWEFLKFYTTRLSFYLEVLIILIALIIYFK
jgi:hypothetical protein